MNISIKRLKLLTRICTWVNRGAFGILIFGSLINRATGFHGNTDYILGISYWVFFGLMVGLGVAAVLFAWYARKLESRTQQ